DVVVDPEMPLMDPTMIDRLYTPAEPRDVEIAGDLFDAMQEVTPQAILRDLHRSEETFAKQFEIVDPVAEGRVDASAVVAEGRATAPSPPPPGPSASGQGRAALREIRAERGKPWVHVLSLNLPNRRVTE